MPNRKVIVELSEEIINMIGEKKIDLSKRVKELTILELYREHKLSSGKAAESFNMSKWEFIRFTGRLGIPFIEMDEEHLKMIL